jgi:hypothetical protein
MLQLHNGPFRNAAMQHLHECHRWGLHPFSLGHFLAPAEFSGTGGHLY